LTTNVTCSEKIDHLQFYFKRLQELIKAA